MKKRYTFLALLGILLYLLYLVGSYKYTEYKIYTYIQKLTKNNALALEEIKATQEILEKKSTKAYKNKILKAQANRKNPGEEVVFFISEEIYNQYTQELWIKSETQETPQNTQDEESLIASMSIYERWIYFLFQKDIR